MRVVYAQRVFFPTITAHAVHTCTTVGEVAALGVPVDFFPGGTLGPGRSHLMNFFRSLGFSGAEADKFVAFPVASRALYGLWFRAQLARRGGQAGAVLHATSLKEAIMALNIKKALGFAAPLFFEIHHLISQLKTGDEARGFLEMEQRIFAEADAIIFNCPELQAQAAGILPEPRKALVLPLGFNQRVFSPLAEGPADRPCRDICYVGTLQAGKGVMGLVDMLGFLPEDFRLTIVGGKPESRLEELRGKAQAAGVAGRITFCGQMPQNQVAQCLPAGSIFVIPLRTAEDFLAPMKMYEALGLGMPIVASPMPSLRGFLAEGTNAVFAADPSPQALAMAVLRLAEDDALRQTLRAANREKALEHSNARRAKRLVEIWEQAL